MAKESAKEPVQKPASVPVVIPPPMAEPTDGSPILTIRWDSVENKPVVDLGGWHPAAAHTLLQVAAHSLWATLIDAEVRP